MAVLLGEEAPLPHGQVVLLQSASVSLGSSQMYLATRSSF
jgi:hypothetical protein